MPVSDAQVEELRTRGFVRVPGFLRGRELEQAKEAFAMRFPTPEAYFSDPDRYPEFRGSAFSGVAELPFRCGCLDRAPFHPDLVHVAERFLGSTDIRLCKAELWAKYQGATDYEQDFHRDFPNHTLLVPSRDPRFTELQSFLFLSDVDEDDGPTEVIPTTETKHISLGRTWLAPDRPRGAVRMTGAAGTLFLFSFEVFHRATPISAERGVRFTMQADFRRADTPWVGKHNNWGCRGLSAHMVGLVERLTPRQRELLDFPPMGHPYWTEQTLRDLKVRYPNLDLAPYRIENPEPHP